MQSVSSRQKMGDHEQGRRRGWLPGLACLALIGIGTWSLSVPSPAVAQQTPATDTALAGSEVWYTHCSFCHGVMATGGTDDDTPIGPSLRTTKLKLAEIREI